MRLLPALLLAAAGCAIGAAPAGASERAVRTKIVHAPEAPVDLRHASLRLAETYATPTQLSPPDGSTQQNRIRYANRAGLQKSRLLLKGEVACDNKTRVPIEAISLAVTALDAFGEPLPFEGAPAGTIEQQIVVEVPGRGRKRLAWEQPMKNEAIYEIAVSVSRVRFTDGTVWSAPGAAAPPATVPPPLPAEPVTP